jgi:hypothetical protein
MANGTYTNTELVDTIIVDLNNIPAKLIAGQFIQACAVVAQMGQKLANLRDGIKADIASKDRTIEELKHALRNAGETVEDLTPEEFASEIDLKGGAGDGTN